MVAVTVTVNGDGGGDGDTDVDGERGGKREGCGEREECGVDGGENTHTGMFFRRKSNHHISLIRWGNLSWNYL